MGTKRPCKLCGIAINASNPRCMLHRNKELCFQLTMANKQNQQLRWMLSSVAWWFWENNPDNPPSYHLLEFWSRLHPMDAYKSDWIKKWEPSPMDTVLFAEPKDPEEFKL